MSVILHQLAEQPPFTQMNSFILQTDHNHLIVIDGGNKADAEYLLDYLRQLGGARPVVDAWFLTHIHSDHVDAFMELLDKHADELEVRRVLYRFPKAEMVDRYESWEVHTAHEFEAFQSEIMERETLLNAGDAYEFDGVTIRVLRVLDEAITANFINNTSSVLRVEAEGQSILFLGDLGVEAGEELLARYGAEGLHADFVQMAHHGQNGVARSLYEAVSPRACLWCTPLWLWENDAGKGYDTHEWKTIVVRGWMSEIGVRHHFVTKDGTHAIPLPFDFEAGTEKG